MVILWYLASIHDSKLENATIPIAAPERKIRIIGISKLDMAVIINRYLPSSSRIKLPEIPGSIIAQMAIAPDRNINQ